MLEQPDCTSTEIDPRVALCDQAEFAQELAELVADEAPRLFAVVQEYGERADGWIAAWGMAFEDHAEVVGLDRPINLHLSAPENACRVFSRRPHITAHVVWVNPEAATRPETEDPAQLDAMR
ncbi:MAG: hypothetical protein ACRDSR_17415 [Pseudonocardiaceae bacterium]